jgi:methionyl-tRNA formyltransferase
MRIVFMGTPDFAVGSLRALVRAGYEVVLAVTQPDKPQGRKQILVEPAVKTAAKELGIPVFQPKRVREPEALEEIRRYEPELIVVAAFGQILPKELLDMPSYGCINVHASLLPKYRGAAPIQWAILNGDAVTGVTIMRMDVGLDTGDMIAKTELAIEPEDTGGSLFDRLAAAGAGLLVDTIPSIVDGTAVYTPQDPALATKVGQISKKDGEIDFTRTAVQIANQVRGLNPWPSAYTHISGKTLKIWSASAAPGGSGQPGEIVEITKNSFSIQTGEGVLVCREVQLEGKKRMSAGDFLRGNSLETGMKL